MGYRVGDTIRANFALYGETTDARFSGADLSDFSNVILWCGELEKTSILTVVEIGSTGEYYWVFTPDQAGDWELMYTEPAGTEENHQRMVWTVGEYRGL